MALTSPAAVPEIPLWPNGCPGRIDDGQGEVTTDRDNIRRVEHVHDPALYPFLADPATATGAAVVICPGGGYAIVAIEHEGTDVARWFNSFGISAFVLKYRMSPYQHPIPLMDGQHAMRIVRSRAGEWGIDPQRIGIMGFSAGGHLASTVATHFDRPVHTDGPLASVSCRPDFAIFGYPVISFANDKIAHKGSRTNLLGDRTDPRLFEGLSAERQVTERTPPAFFFHATNDGGVLPDNSLVFADALRAKGIPASVKLQDRGGHGFGLRVDDWTESCIAWLREQGIASAAPHHSRVPGVVIDHQPARSGLYVGSPSITRLPDGRLLASHDIFGPKSTKSTHGVTRVFRTDDQGTSWRRAAEIAGQFWSTLFVHGGDVYLMGVDRQNGNAVIRRSGDAGSTWTEPRDSASGILLADGDYHCAPVPVLFHGGRIWRAMEDTRGGGKWGDCFRSFMMSAPADADLLRADSWTCSNRLARNPDWLDGRFGGWLEGNAVAGPDGTVWNILRTDFRALPEKASMVRISDDGQEATFDPKTGFVDFPGGCKKFTIRYDEESGLYWTLSNYTPTRHRDFDIERTRNTVALSCSRDLKQWEMRCVVLYHPDTTRHGFQYLDWQFDGHDLIVASRTAYDDGMGGAHLQHDANYLTFHRIRAFRTRRMVDSCRSFHLHVGATESTQAQQVTTAPHGHTLTNINAWSPDSQWLVYDVRRLGHVFDGDRIEKVNVRTGEVKVLYESRDGAHCGVVTHHPTRDQVVFIHGPAQPSPDWKYAAHHRRGAIVDGVRPGVAVNLDARDLASPFTPGALRGGTHVHVYSGDGQWISSTYEDHVLAALGDAADDHDRNQRNVAVSVLGRPVTVGDAHPRNHDGEAFTVLVTRTVNEPQPGSDEISKAFSDAWVGTNGYARPDGTRQARAIAFQGHVRTRDGATIPEVFIVDLPDDLTVPGDGPLAGTGSRRPSPPRGVVQRRLTRTEDRKHPGLQGPRHWLRSSPDGSRIAFFMRDDDGIAQVWTISPNGGDPVQVTKDPWEPQSAFSWSPDGRQLAYAMDNSVFVTDIASGVSVRLTERAPDREAPTHHACVFSPNGEQIATMRPVETDGAWLDQLFVVSTDAIR